MAKRKAIDWTVITTDGEMKCLRCGATHQIEMPIGVYELSEKVRGFNLLHKRCEAAPPTQEKKP